MNLKAFLLNKNRYLETCSIEEFIASRGDDKRYWIDMADPGQKDLEEFFAPMDLHPLILETCLDMTAGYRVAPYEHSLFIRMPIQLAWDNPEQSFLSIICLSWAIITIHDRPVPVLDAIAAEFSTAVRFHAMSTSAILYQALDHLIDEDLSFALESLHAIDSLEEAVDKDEHTTQTDRIMAFKRHVARLSTTFEDQHYCVTALQAVESDVFDISDFREYFRDSLAHLEYALRSVDRQQARLAELNQHNLLMLQDKTNKRLRLLTIISAVFMPLTLIAGIYGMNFLYMPELKWHYSYPAVLALMLAIAAGLLWLFQKRGWFK